MVEYVTREDIVGGGAFATELTDDFDDASPGDINIQAGQRIVEMIVAAKFMSDAEDDAGVFGVRFQGSAVTGTPTIPVGGGGIGAAGTGVESSTQNGAVRIPLDIPLSKGKLRIFAVGNMTANSLVYMAVGVTIA